MPRDGGVRPVPSGPMTDTTAGRTGAEGPPLVVDGAASDGRAARRRRARTLVEWSLVLLGAMVLSIVVRAVAFQSFYIPSESMVPTLEVDDRVIVNKLEASLGDLGRGDIIVFERPEGVPGEIEDLIKRVIALPGETVEGRGGQVWVDGAPLAEPWLPEGVVTSPFPPTVVPDGTIWVMGDNRGNSSDSRVFGPIDADLVLGQAVVRVWPLDRAGGL